MPCYEPTASRTDVQAQRTAKAIVILCSKLGLEPPKQIEALKMTDSRYFNGSHCNDLTSYLCGAMKLLTVDQLEQIVYNGHDKDSRFLADWWDEHQENDKKQI